MGSVLRRNVRMEWMGALYDKNGLLRDFGASKNGWWDVYFEQKPRGSPPLGTLWVQARNGQARHPLLGGYIVASEALRRQRMIELERAIVECKGKGYILHSHSRMRRCTLSDRCTVTMYWTNAGRRGACLRFAVEGGCTFLYDG